MSPGEQPAAQGSRFQAESEQKKKEAQKKEIKAPQIEVAQEKAAPPAAPGLSFTLKSVKVTGVALFKPEDLYPAYASYIGQQVDFNDLEQIAAAIKNRYKKEGYLTTDVYIPEQDITQGEVEIRVSEGRLGELSVEGNKWFSGALLVKFIHFKKNQILNIFKLQKDLLRLNQNPDLDVTAVLSPGKDPGSTDIVLKIADRCPYHAGFSYDNQGTRLVGKDRFSFSFRSTNLSGLNDSFAVNRLASATSAGEFLSYTFPLGTKGTRIGFDFTNFFTKLGEEYSDLDITGSTQIYTPHLSLEMYLSQDFQAYADLGIDIKSIRKRNNGNAVTSDQIRMPYAAFDFAKTDSFLGGGQTIFAPRFSFSLDHCLGATNRDHALASRPDTGGFFFKYEQALKRIQRAAWGSFISIRSQFLTASHTLPSSEQLQLGGLNSVRGYPEGEFLADIGVAVNFEWAFPGYIFPKGYKLPYAKMALRDQFQPVIFFDLGEGKLKKVNAGEERRRSLKGAGAGLRFQFNRNFYLRLDWAKSLGDEPTQGQGESSLYLTCQAEF